MIGLPSLRALDGAHRTRIWLAPEATDPPRRTAALTVSRSA